MGDLHATDSPSPGARAARASGVPLWLELSGEPLYAVLHCPEGGARRDVAVLMLPPFGWEQARSYRARREWATSLAQAGFVTLRFDLPGTEDSAGSPTDPGRPESWRHAVAASAAWLRELCPRARVATIGIALGGLLAVDGLASGARIDDLILWAVPARGRSSLRELQNYAAFVASQYGADEAPDGAEDVIGLAGYPISAEIASWLESLDLTAAPIAEGNRHRVLMIHRDARGVDQRLHDHLAAAGVEMTVMPATDFATLTKHPQMAEVPRESIIGSIQWLRERSGEMALDPSVSAAPAAAGSAVFEVEGTRLRETFTSLDGPAGREYGIVCEPEGQRRGELWLMMTNPGALRRTGPNRMWTSLARRQAAKGLASVRFDLEGLGDSDGDPTQYIETSGMYSPHLVQAHQRWLDAIHAAVPDSQQMPIGLCSGAHLALNAAASSPHVRGAVLINLLAFDYSDQLESERRLRRIGEFASGRLSLWRNRPKITREYVRGVWQVLRERLRSRAGTSAEEQQAAVATELFDRLQERRVRTLFLFSRDEPAYHELSRQGLLGQLARWPEVTIDQLPTADHEFRALAMQALVNERIDAAIDEVLNDLT